VNNLFVIWEWFPGGTCLGGISGLRFAGNSNVHLRDDLICWGNMDVVGG
jgi:hypothetical protein